jgi:hypothetical protein
MTAVSSGRYKLAIFLFISVLLVFLIGTDIFLVKKLRSQLLYETYNEAQSEIELVEILVREPLLKNNYDEVEQFLLQWKEEHDNVIAIEAVMPNGFKLIESTGTEDLENSIEVKKHIQYMDKDLISIRVVKNFTHAGIMKKLQKQLIIGSIILTFFFGLILWLTIRKYALMPLERSKDQLETFVREHTKTWEEANINLISEIDMRKKTQTQLKAKIKELEEFYNMTVGREMKLKTLKDEIAKLKTELKSRAAANS